MAEIPRGAIRFNTDSNKPELWDGSQWAEFQLSTPNLGRSVDSSLGGRAVLVSGWTGSSNTDNCDYWNMASTGNAVDFGDSTVSKEGRKGTSSHTRGVMGGGDPSQITTIDSIQIATLGNAVDFGDLTAGRAYLGATSNNVRGVFGGGNSPPIANDDSVVSPDNLSESKFDENNFTESSIAADDSAEAANGNEKNGKKNEIFPRADT